MSTNPHFDGTVRLQSDVGHRVFEGGPCGSRSCGYE